MLGSTISTSTRPEGTKREFDGGSEEYEAVRAFVAEGLVLVGGLQVGKNRVGHAKPTWMVL